MMNLPFLRKRKGARAQESSTDKLVGASSDELLEDQMIDELLDAVEDKNPGQFRTALTALVLNSFEYDEDDDE